MKKNKVLNNIGKTVLAGSLVLGGFTGVGLQEPVAVEASAYQSVDLKQGMRHQDVVQLKKDLAKAGFKVTGKGTTLFGSQTNKQVKAFQKYYSLTVNGVVNNATKNKLKEVVNSPLQNGKRHKNTIQLKKDLASAGFKVPGKGTSLYGKGTEKQVKAFQKKYKLVQNGIADSVTLKKLESVANPTLENGVRHQDVVQLKKDLAKAGFKVPGKGTRLFGKQTEVQVKAFQKYYGLSQTGKVDSNTDKQLRAVVNSSLQRGKRHKDTIQLKKDLAEVGFKVAGKGTNLYGKATEQQVKAFQKKYKLVTNGIADKVTLNKLAAVVKDVTAPKVLENGVRHKDVVQLKKDLAKAGFTVPGKGTTFFGKQTEVQVKAFQKYYGLSQTGKVDSNTDKKIKAVVNTDLQNGKRHKDTVQLKKNLAVVGFTVPGNNTTLYGKQTEKQVKAFQKKHGLVQNGLADEKTLAKLQEAVKKAELDSFTGTKEETKTNTLKYNTIKKNEPTLDKGKTKVSQKGKNGKEEIVYEVKYVKGKEVERNEINRNVTDPVDEIILVGTKVTEVKTVTDTVDVPFKQETIKDNKMALGQEKVVTKGQNGTKEVTYEVTYVNGKEESRVEKGSKVTKKPVNEVVKVGTVDVEAERQEALRLINEYRVANGRQPLKVDSRAMSYAQNWSKVLGGYEEVTSDNSHSNVVEDFKQYVDIGSVGENYVGGLESRGAIDAWKWSPGHNANMLRERYTHFGIGFEVTNGKGHWTLILFQQVPQVDGKSISTMSLEVPKTDQEVKKEEPKKQEQPKEEKPVEQSKEDSKQQEKPKKEQPKVEKPVEQSEEAPKQEEKPVEEVVPETEVEVIETIYPAN